MKYYNFKRYKFSTITKYTRNLLIKFSNFFNFLNIIKYQLKKAFKKIALSNYSFEKFSKYFNYRTYDFNIRKIEILSSKFLLIHLPLSIIFFFFLYLVIPTFYKYEKSNIKKLICKSSVTECIIRGKVKYVFFPTPRIKITDFILNDLSKDKKTIITSENIILKLSYKNLLAVEKQKLKSIDLNNFEIYFHLNNFKKYKKELAAYIDYVPTNFFNGKIIFFDKENYVTTISDSNIDIEKTKNLINAEIKGKFLEDDLVINFLRKKIENNQINTEITFKMNNMQLLAKTSFKDSVENAISGNFLIKKNKNKIAALFNYKNNELEISKSNFSNSFLEGKITGKIIFLPFFDFVLDFDLNSINFTKLYNAFLSLNIKDQKNIFKINKKFNGSLSLNSDKIYSKFNIVKSLEARAKFNNGNISINQFIFNLGKLGAADLVGEINNNNKNTYFKFESNIFVDNKKKFLSKFGIYNKKNFPSNFFISGNLDIENIKATFYEIYDDEKLANEDVNFVEKEFNNYMLDEEFKNLFIFPKFKEFVKIVADEKN